MNNLWIKIKSWFRFKSAPKKPVSRPKSVSPKPAPLSRNQLINHKHYRKLIGKIAKTASQTTKEELLMNNFDIFVNTFAGFRTNHQPPRKNFPNNNCPGNCQAQINGFFWLSNQRYWVYKCACCGARQIKKNQQPAHRWGGQDE